MALTNHSQPSSGARALHHTVPLVVGDVLAFLAFAVIGLASHGTLTSRDALFRLAEAAGPFAVGWFVIAPFSGVFRRDVASRPRAMLARTAVTWLCAWPIGLGLRALLLQRSIPEEFAIIALLTNLIILVGWRGIFAWFAGRNRRS